MNNYLIFEINACLDNVRAVELAMDDYLGIIHLGTIPLEDRDEIIQDVYNLLLRYNITENPMFKNLWVFD